MNDCQQSLPKMVLSHCSVVCSAGNSWSLIDQLTNNNSSSLTYCENWLRDRGGYFGVVTIPDTDSCELSKTHSLLKHLMDEMCTSIEQFKSRYSSDRIGVIIATTTSGIHKVEDAPELSDIDYHLDQEMSSASAFVAHYCDINGPNICVSTACTSGAKVFGLAQQLINGGWCDAAIVGASESLCRMTCQGFDALESYAADRSKPFQADRDGINIGEGAALFLVEPGSSGIVLAGYGESSDAYHESAPDPEGKGAEAAIEMALLSAQCQPRDIDYINLHGTGTPLNDAMESGVMSRIFGYDVKMSTTKSAMGHTLGASGAIEAAVLWLLLNHNGPTKLPVQNLNGNYDVSLPRLNFVDANDNDPIEISRALSTSFAFGGHNTAVVLERV